MSAKQDQIFELKNLDNYSLENVFSVYKEGDQYFYNILNTVNIPEDLDRSLYDFYIIKQGDIWPLISYRIYGTIKLWWVICCANQIQNPLQMPVPGTKIKILNSNTVSRIINQISSQ